MRRDLALLLGAVFLGFAGAKIGQLADWSDDLSQTVTLAAVMAYIVTFVIVPDMREPHSS